MTKGGATRTFSRAASCRGAARFVQPTRACAVHPCAACQGRAAFAGWTKREGFPRSIRALATCRRGAYRASPASEYREAYRGIASQART